MARLLAAGTKQMTTEQITIREFVRLHLLPMSTCRVAQNRSMPDSEGMDHWYCTLRAPGGRKMGVTFSMGSGHHGRPPEAEEVLSCLARDASLAADSFADFCANCGYDEDSRKAFRSYRQTRRQTYKLSQFLTPEQFELLLCGTEQL